MITGTVGFIVAALAIGAFALTAKRAYVVVDPSKLNLFTLAFGFLAVDMVLWAIGVSFPGSVNLVNVLFTSDVLLLLGTGCMALLLYDKAWIPLKLLVGLLGASCLTLRAFQYPPLGYVRDGLLYFNLTGGVRTVFLLAFVLIWLPAMVVVARQLARDRAFGGLQASLTNSFVVLIMTTGIFLSARRSVVIVTMFVAVIILFVAMTVINLFVLSLHKQLKAGHHAS